VSLFCAVADKQKQNLSYAAYGKEITSLLFLSNKEVKTLESFPFPLNGFPGMIVVENSVSFISGSKLVLIRNGALSDNPRNGGIALSQVGAAVSSETAASCEDLAKGIQVQLCGLHKMVAGKKDIAVMVSCLEGEIDTAWEEVISISIPIRNYGEMMECLDRKLSSLVEDNFKRHQIITSINEVVLNAAFFAYKKSGEGEISLRLFKLRDEIIVEVCDHGCGFNIENYREPDVMRYNDLTRKSGRGIFLIRNLMDRVMIQSSKEIGTAVYMAKRVTCNEN